MTWPSILWTLLVSQALAPATVREPAPAPGAAWTFLIYAAVDNDAEPAFLEFLDRLQRSLDPRDSHEVILFIDRSAEYSADAEVLGEDFAGARVYRLHREGPQRLDARPYLPGVGEAGETELDSGSPETLRAFLAFGLSEYPARHTGLLLYGHGNGVQFCHDDESGSWMSPAGVSRAIPAEQSVDFLALELCNMASLELAYQWRPGNGAFSAKVLVAIPNAGIPLDWDRILARIEKESVRSEGSSPSHALTPQEMGRLAIEEGLLGRRARLEQAIRSGQLDLSIAEHLEHVREAAVCLDLGRASAAKRAIDRFASSVRSGDQRVLFSLRGTSHSTTLLHYAPRGKLPARPFIDAYDLMARLESETSLGAESRAAAEAACQALDDLVLSSFGLTEGFPGFEPGHHGVFLVFPAKPSSPPSGRSVLSDFPWYFPRASKDTGPDGGWSFLGDGARENNGIVESWFELLDSHFDGRRDSNGYVH